MWLRRETKVREVYQNIQRNQNQGEYPGWYLFGRDHDLRRRGGLGRGGGAEGDVAEAQFRVYAKARDGPVHLEPALELQYRAVSGQAGDDDQRRRVLIGGRRRQRRAGVCGRGAARAAAVRAGGRGEGRPFPLRHRRWVERNIVINSYWRNINVQPY